MAHSHHTDKEWLTAAREMPRNPDGSIRYPTIIARKPRRGDIHPLAKSNLEKMMPGIRLEYLFGLKRIELRPRLHPSIGEPFGCYLIREQTIILYSLPLEWRFDQLSNGWRELLVTYQATVEEIEGGFRIIWPGQPALTLWFWDQVFYHELGHHFVEQYKNRNRRVRTKKEHEFKADLHVGRYLSRRFQRFRKPLEQEEPAPKSENI